jgi:hypothetical protein
MRALSIRQPYAELILRGVKTIEYRSRPTKIIGQRFYIYAARKWAGVSLPLPMGEGPRNRGDGAHGSPNANGHALTPDPSPKERGERAELPTGVIVGSAVISHCTNGGTGSSAYHWHLKDVRRFKKPRRPKRQPQPVWFNPF